MSRLPTKAEILAWITENPTLTAKRDIAKAFGIKGAARIDLKRLLRELEAEGELAKRKKTYRDPDHLPPVTVLEIEIGEDGALAPRPLEWHGEGKAPKLSLISRASDPTLAVGDRILAKLTRLPGSNATYDARLIRRIGSTQRRIVGLFRKGAEGGRILPIDKGQDKEWQVAANASLGAKDGELVEAEQTSPPGRFGLPKARITARIGDPSAPRAVSLIAIHQHGIPDDFPEDAMAEADGMKPVGLSEREDLRHLPLITIDPPDARDHDDAVYAMPDPDWEGGHILWIAIADVAYYVRSGSALDREARRRGNSSYFPDRVVPMLPDRLSGDLCSLHAGVPRPCLALELKIDADGATRKRRFVRGLMTSPAALTYTEVQKAIDGAPSARAAPLVKTVLQPLYAAYDALKRARARRHPLELDLPERRIQLSEAGDVTSVHYAERFDAHRLIEEFMVRANEAAAEVLIAKGQPLLFRVHEEPPPDKLESLRDTAEASGFSLAKGQVLKTEHLNRLLDQAAGSPDAETLNLATLRSMTQAYYSPKNFGHFGLALANYAHFTSPIRRYADLVVHRALAAAHGWEGGLSDADVDHLDATATQISATERRSMAAERDTTDRYLAAYLSERIGAEFDGRVAGIAKFGLFVKLNETGADGLVPISSLGNEYFQYDRDTNTLMGSRSGRLIGLGMPARVKLTEAAPVTGGLAFQLLTLDGVAMDQSHAPRPTSAQRLGKPGPQAKRKLVKAKKKEASAMRKVTRQRRAKRPSG